MGRRIKPLPPDTMIFKKGALYYPIKLAPGDNPLSKVEYFYDNKGIRKGFTRYSNAAAYLREHAR